MVELLYLAWNRREFTRMSMNWLLEHTNWELVSKLTVYDDGSTDGTYEWLEEHLHILPVETHLERTHFRSPARSMVHFLERPREEFWAKLDSDILVPPLWLESLLGVMAKNPDLELLGMEAGMAEKVDYATWDGTFTITDCSHIGGIGLFRTKAFKSRPSITPSGRFGFTEWQARYHLRRGWITPDLPVLSQDRIPLEPYASLAAEYDRAGWHRASPWPKYPEDAPFLDQWGFWPKKETA